MVPCPLCGHPPEDGSTGSAVCPCGCFNIRAEGSYWRLDVGSRDLTYYPGFDGERLLFRQLSAMGVTVSLEEIPGVLDEMRVARVLES